MCYFLKLLRKKLTTANKKYELLKNEIFKFVLTL